MRLLPALLPVLALSVPLAPRSVSHASLLSLSLLPHDLSTTDARHPDKYFHESVLHPHYDGRFARTILPPSTRLFHMRLLVATYMRTMAAQHVRTWLMHGSLLGWWWNGRVMPWDSDVDVQIDEAGLGWLAAWANMTVHAFSAADLGLVGDGDGDGESGQGKPAGLHVSEWERVLDQGKKYLLEINPHVWNRSTADTHNVIDARWIDVATGLFIDITTAHPVVVPAKGASVFSGDDGDGDDDSDAGFAFAGDEDQPRANVYTKDQHLYPRAALFPLRETMFEGVPVSVPYAYEALLLDEYGKLALTETWYRGYAFVRGTDDAEWVVAPPQS